MIERVSLGKIPIMLYSNLCVLNKKNIHETEECKFDKGGYFIINGSEKVIVSQERRAENRLYVCKNSKSQNKYDITAEINSMISSKIVVPKTVLSQNRFSPSLFSPKPSILQTSTCEGRMVPGSAVQVCIRLMTVYLCSWTTGPIKMCLRTAFYRIDF